MANRKITELAALTAPAQDDVIPIVDVSETSNTTKNKKITAGNLIQGTPSLVLQLGDGTASAPSLKFTSALTTGLYRSAANELSIATNGGQAIKVEANNKTTIYGDLVVTGGTTTISSTQIDVTDKNLQLATGNSSDSGADGGGLTLKGATDKTWNWVDSTDAWTANQHIDVTTGKVFKIAGTEVLNATTLGSGVVSSSLTSVGTLGSLTVTNAVTAGSLDISGGADIDGTLEADAYTVNGTALNEYIADTVGAMVSSNTETNITVTYQDADNTLDFVIGTLNQDTTGNAATATALETARTIGGVSFNGTANINLPGVNQTGNQNTTGSAATLTTARTIGGVSFDGSANINLPGVNAAGNQNTSGTAAGLSGTPNITVGVVTAGSLDVSGDADIDGTLEADAITVDGTALNEFIADTVGAMVSSNTETNIAVTYDDSDNTLDFVISSYPAASISGTTLASNVVTSSLTSVGTLGSLNVTNTVTANLFSGSGASLTALNADNISSGTLASARIEDDAITRNKISDGEVISSKLDSSAVTTSKINNGAITNDKISSSAAIAGTKISPDFGSQHVITTGQGRVERVLITSSHPRIDFIDSNSNPDWSIINNEGILGFYDDTNGAYRLNINTDGHVDVTGNLDVGAGLDVTGNITVTGTVDGVDIATRDTLFGGLTSSSGVLTNGVTATTQSASDNSTKVATTAYTDTAISNLVDSSPSALNTLNELAAALGDDANFSTTVTNSIATKLPLAGGTMSGAINLNSNNITNGGTITGTFVGNITGNVTGNTSGSSGSCTGNAATATALATARTINGVSFDGTGNITVTAAAGTLTGNTLASGVTASSLTSVGTLTGLTVSGNISMTGTGAIDVPTGTTAQRPGSPTTGLFRYNSTEGEFEGYTASGWGAIAGGGGGASDFKYLALRNASNNGAASYPASDFTLVTSGTSNAISPTAANTLLVSVAGVIQQPNTGTSTPTTGFAISGSTIKFGSNISAAPDFIIYQLGAGIGTPSDNAVTEAKLNASNSPTNGYFLQAQSGTTGGLTWAAAPANDPSTGTDFNDNVQARWGTGNDLVVYHNGTHSYIHNTTGNLVLYGGAGSSQGVVTQAVIGENAIIANANGSAELYYDNSKKLETTNNGILLGGSIYANDNTKLILGTGEDLKIYHDGTDSYITNATNQLIYKAGSDHKFFVNDGAETAIWAKTNGAVELYYDNSKKFETIAGGVKATGYLTCDGIYLNSDNDKAFFGAGNDLEIFHDGSNSWIKDVGTGVLALAGSVVQIQNETGGEKQVKCFSNGAVELYYDGSKKLETLDTGVSITGTCTATDFSGGRLSLLDNGSTSPTLLIAGDDGNPWGIQLRNDTYATGAEGLKIFQSNTGITYFQTRGTSARGRLVMQQHNGTTTNNMIEFTEAGAVEIDYAGIKKLETTSAGAKVTGFLNVTTGIHIPDGGNNDSSITIGSGNDLRLYHDGSTNYLYSGNGHIVARVPTTKGFRVQKNDGQEDVLNAFADGAVELYYDGSKKFETTSTGATVYDKLQIGSNDDDPATLELRYSTVPSYLTSTYDGTVGETTLSMNVPRTSDGSASWGSHSNTGWGSAAIQVLSHSSSGGYVTVLTSSADNTNPTEKLRITGDGKVRVPDNGKFTAGASDDLQIWHDGSHTRLNNATGIFNVQTGNFVVSNIANTENIFIATQDDSCKLYYDNSKKLETIANGVQTNGSHFVMDGDGANGNPKFACGNGADLNIYHDGSTSVIKSTSHPIAHYADTRHHFLNPDGSENVAVFTINGANELYYDSSKKLYTYSEGIKVDGYMKALFDVSDSHWGDNTDNWHHFQNKQDEVHTVIFENSSNSTPYGNLIYFSDAAPDDSTRSFYQFSDSAASRCFIYSDGDLWNHDNSYTGSDETLKENIVDATPKLEDLKKLKVRNFNWKADYFPNKSKKKQLGFIAQEVEQVFPSLVSEHDISPGSPTTPGHTPVMKKAIKQAWDPIIIKAMQELIAKVETLETKVAALESA